MKTFFRAQLSSLLATLADFTIYVAAVELAHIHYLIAAVIGAMGGAVTNFIINRIWSFNAAASPLSQQGLRYARVWTGSVALNVSGVYILTHFLGSPYKVSKIIVSVIVGLSFNYLLQKEYVFNTNEKSSA